MSLPLRKFRRRFTAAGAAGDDGWPSVADGTTVIEVVAGGEENSSSNTRVGLPKRRYPLTP